MHAPLHPTAPLLSGPSNAPRPQPTAVSAAAGPIRSSLLRQDAPGAAAAEESAPADGSATDEETPDEAAAADEEVDSQDGAPELPPLPDLPTLPNTPGVLLGTIIKDVLTGLTWV
jgi:hypothetical protein